MNTVNPFQQEHLFLFEYLEGAGQLGVERSRNCTGSSHWCLKTYISYTSIYRTYYPFVVYVLDEGASPLPARLIVWLMRSCFVLDGGTEPLYLPLFALLTRARRAL